MTNSVPGTARTTRTRSEASTLGRISSFLDFALGRRHPHVALVSPWQASLRQLGSTPPVRMGLGFDGDRPGPVLGVRPRKNGDVRHRRARFGELSLGVLDD